MKRKRIISIIFGIIVVIIAQKNVNTIPFEGVSMGLNMDLVNLVMLDSMDLAPKR